VEDLPMRARPLAFATLLALFAPLLAGAVPDARADGERFDVSVTSGGTVTVTSHTGYHINKDYPWKIVSGATTIPAASFTLGDTTASVTGVPTGTATLSGAVCSDSDCRPFHTSVTVQ
jgi:hypothetical protein